MIDTENNLKFAHSQIKRFTLIVSRLQTSWQTLEVIHQQQRIVQ